MIRPLKERVLLRKLKRENSSSLLLSVEIDAHPRFQVVAVGDDVSDVDVGDEVLIEAHRFVPIQVRDEELYLVPMDVVLGVWTQRMREVSGGEIVLNREDAP